MEKAYIAIDLKSFYASVECAERGLDPLNTNLVVADKERTDKTICLAVSPSLKAYGIPGRARLFEVISMVEEINRKRKAAAGHILSGGSFFDDVLKKNPGLKLEYITAPPRMGRYMEYSTKIYGIYLRHVAPEDIHVYSIDEVFIDATPYLGPLGMTAMEFTRMLVEDVLSETGITATAGIGTNLYLCKVAMDIVAKHIAPDEHGVRIAVLDEMEYRRKLWSHTPITDFWRVGRGTARKLHSQGMYTMGDVARCSLGEEGDYHREALLYQMFGVNGELLIDHAWGYEPCTMADIKKYRPQMHSLSRGQVLSSAYTWEKARLVVMEMAVDVAMELSRKKMMGDSVFLSIGYDAASLKRMAYEGETDLDHFGRMVPKSAHGTRKLSGFTASAEKIRNGVMEVFDAVTDDRLLVRRITIEIGNVMPEEEASKAPVQLSMFTDCETVGSEKEKDMQNAVVEIKKRYGKNAIIRGMNLMDGATSMERNRQIGGHKA